MPRFTPKRQEQIFADMLPRVVVQGGLTDVTDTNGVKSILNAFARELDEAYYNMGLLLNAFSIDKAEGSDLDARAADIGTLTRRQSVAASGTVVFSRTGTAGTVAIAQGAKLTTADGAQTFTTTAPGTITAETAPSVAGHAKGQDSVAVPIIAQDAGASGNVAAGAITSIVSALEGVSSVINLAATVGGQDVESDDAFRARIRSYVASLPRATIQSLTTAVLGATDPDTGRTISYAAIAEDTQTPGVVTLLVDDGTGQATSTAAVQGERLTQGFAGPPPNTAVGGERRFFLDRRPVHPDEGVTLTSSTRGALVMGTDFHVTPSTGQLLLAQPLTQGEALTADYTCCTGIIALAQRIVEGDPANRAQFPGYRAAGITVNVRTPQVVTTQVDATVTVADGYDPDAISAACISAVTTYVNGLGIGDDIVRASLIAAMMNITGVNNLMLASPAADVPVLDDQIARIAASQVTVL